MSEKTRNDLLFFTTITSVVATAYAGLIAQGDDMINYVCVDQNPFLWIFPLYRWLSCKWYVTIGTVISTSLAIYITFVVILWLIRFTAGNGLRLSTVNNINQQFVQDQFIGFYTGIGLRIYNKNSYKITECYGTLESVQQVFIQNKKLIYENLDTLGVDVSKKLRWANKDYNNAQCEISMLGKSNENILFVANFIQFAEVIEKRKKQELKRNDLLTFNFAYCGTRIGSYRIPGLYKVRVRINGIDLSNNSAVVDYYDGYLYSYVKEIAPDLRTFDVYWTKDPLKDKRILNDSFVVKPAPRRLTAVSKEEQKTNEKALH